MNKSKLALLLACFVLAACGPDPDPVCEPPCAPVFHAGKIVDCICGLQAEP